MSATRGGWGTFLPGGGFRRSFGLLGAIGVWLGLALLGWSAPPGSGEFELARGALAVPVHVTAEDWPGVARAAGDLCDDVQRVVGVRPELLRGPPAAATVVVAGTIGRSTLIDDLVARGRLDVSAVRGRWEAFQSEVVEEPWPGVRRALVIAGSDKRGTIYGLYDISERIGVSPWYWWADVPVERRESAVVSGRTVETGPTVRYRGIFLNDEAPALVGWAHEKFGGFNSRFYAKVFELLLRLRANYLWPAMWLPRAFGDDDRANIALADEFGIVMGTSHHEPMMRAHAEWGRHGGGPWNYEKNGAALRDFWRGGLERSRGHESLVTLGMRGDGDEAMSEETNVALLERIVADQRAIIADVTGRPAPETPQLWALYKEVQGYYERGMRVPDDVTLLWCDDNWSNLRRLPAPGERQRPGGAGIYYHFDYVGGPRNYKWLNTVPLTKIWEQMHLAAEHGADRIWIVNVGDLKPMEFPIEFFLRLAWRPSAIGYDDLPAYGRAWAARQFGAAHADEIAALIAGYTKLNSRRKPELLAPDTFSLLHHREAERVLGEWTDLQSRAHRVKAALPGAAHPAFLQLVQHPIEAGRVVNELLVTAGRNRLHATQGRASTNASAERARDLFRLDAALTARWDGMLDGKWRHMMDQTHLGYTSWQQPIRNVMPAVSEVHVPAAGELAIAVEGDPAARPGDYPITAVATLPPLSPFGPEARWFDVFNRGAGRVAFTIESDAPWLRLSATAGELGPDQRIEVSADWSAVPPGRHRATIRVRDSAVGATRTIQVPVDNEPVAGAGLVETDGFIAIDAPNHDRAIAVAGVEWRTLAGFGRGVGAVTSRPATAGDTPPGGAGPRLEYDVVFRRAGEFRVELHVAPTFDFLPGRELALAVSLDDGPPQVLKLGLHATDARWERAVADSVVKLSAPLIVTTPGAHVLKVWRVTPAVVLERILVDTGGLKPSYLGPPQSGRAPR